MKSIVLAEDHSVVRNGIKLILESQKQFCVIGEATNGHETLELLKKNIIPDIVITDINMEGMNGVELTQYISSHYPEVKVVVLSMMDDNQFIFKCFEKGAQAYLLKNISYDELLFAIQHVANGGRYLCESLSMTLIEKLRESSVNKNDVSLIIREIDLSDRELEVLTLIGEGYTNMEIADKLFLSKRTVEGHRQSLIDKTKVKNSAELIKFAVKNGLI